MTDLVTRLVIKAKNLADSALNAAKRTLGSYGDTTEEVDQQTLNLLKGVKKLDDELKNNTGTKKAIDDFAKLRKNSKQLKIDLDKTKKQTKDLGKAFALSSQNTDKLNTSLSNSKQKTKDLVATKKILVNTSNKQQKATKHYTQLLDSLNTNISKSRNNTKELTKSLSDNKKEARELSKQFTNSKKALKSLSAQQERATASTQRLRNELRETGINTGRLIEESKRLKHEYKNLPDRKKKLASSLITLATNQQKAATTQKELTQSTAKFDSVLSSTTNKVLAFGAAYLGLNKLKQGFLSILNVGGHMETMGITLQSLMGSIEGGEKATAWIKDFAKNTPLQLNNVSDAFIRLKAFGLDPMGGVMQKLTDLSSKLGGGQVRLQGIILAVGQAWSKGKLQAEEANQLIERGVPVWDLMSKALGKTTAKIQEMASNSLLGRKEITQLIDAMGESSLGASAALMKSWAGLVSNAKDTYTNFLAAIAEAGVLDYFKDQLTALNATIDKMAKDGSLKEWAKSISEGIVSVSSGISSTIQFIYQYADAIALITAAYAKTKFTGFIIGLSGVNRGLVDTRTQTEAATKSSNKYATSLKNLAGIAKAGLYTAMVSEIINVVDAYQQLREQQKKNVEASAQLSKNTETRLIQAKQEAEALGVNTKALGDNLSAIVDAVIAKREAIKADQELTESNTALSKSITITTDAYTQSFDSITTLSELQTKLTEETQEANKALSDLSNTAIEDLLKQIEALNNSPILSGDSWDDLKQNLITEQLKRVGVSLEEITNQVTTTGKASSKAFDNLLSSGAATKQQLAEVATELIKVAKTSADIDLLTTHFKKAGIEIEKQPALISAIVKKSIEMGTALNDIPKKWRDIASSIDDTKKAQEDLNTASHAYEKRMDRLATQQQHFNDIVAAGHQAEIDAEQFRNDRKARRDKEDEERNQPSKFSAFSEQTSKAYADLSPDSITRLEKIINSRNSNSGGFNGLSVEEIIKQLAAQQQSQERAAERQEASNREIVRSLSSMQPNVKVLIDSREIITTIMSDSRTSR